MSTCGPFASVAEFHDYLVAPVQRCPRPDWVAKDRKQLPDTYEICFAHADLSWENILVDASTGKVNAILDWEMAGFWPEWWEYRKGIILRSISALVVQAVEGGHDGVSSRNRG